MGPRDEKLKLTFFYKPGGHHLSSWRLPESDPLGWSKLSYLADLARTAERGKFDAIFIADADGVWQPNLDALSRDGGVLFLEPFTLAAALAAVTERIGLVVSASTSFREPYLVARKIGSLDFLSNGRAAWNIVTSSQSHIAANFGMDDLLPHAERYRIANEYVEVVKALWDSWDDGAIVADKASGKYLNLDALRLADHHGERFSVRGPLNLPRPPQGYPVLVQAGSSEAGNNLAAKHADMIFTVQNTIDTGRSFYADVKERTKRAGRAPQDIKIQPGIMPLVADSDQEADDIFGRLLENTDPANGLSLLGGYGCPIDMTKYTFDDPFPELPPTEGQKWRRDLIQDMARRSNYTIGELCRYLASTRAHLFVKGTPKKIADVIEEWFVERAADGFNVMPPILPASLKAFVDKVIPELQRRGIFRTEYEGTTFREHLGVARPSRPQAAPGSAADAAE